jgi:hypothetical protein
MVIKPFFFQRPTHAISLPPIPQPALGSYPAWYCTSHYLFLDRCYVEEFPLTHSTTFPWCHLVFFHFASVFPYFRQWGCPVPQCHAIVFTSGAEDYRIFSCWHLTTARYRCFQQLTYYPAPVPTERRCGDRRMKLHV